MIVLTITDQDYILLSICVYLTNERIEHFKRSIKKKFENALGSLILVEPTLALKFELRVFRQAIYIVDPINRIPIVHDRVNKAPLVYSSDTQCS